MRMMNGEGNLEILREKFHEKLNEAKKFNSWMKFSHWFQISITEKFNEKAFDKQVGP